MQDETNSGSDPMDVEIKKNVAATISAKVAEEVNRLGEEAYSKGLEVRRECEHFATQLVEEVKKMETYVRGKIEEIRHANDTIRAIRARYAKPDTLLENHTQPEPEPQHYDIPIESAITPSDLPPEGDGEPHSFFARRQRRPTQRNHEDSTP